MKHIFLIGAPRSGTTWLQLLLAQSSSIATSSETHLFTYYLNQLENRWQHEKSRASEGYKVSGLTQTINDDVFYELLKKFSEGVFRLMHEKNPEATFILEKTPEHTLHADLILRVFPEAYFIHIMRDPRSVANSFSKAARTWWTWTQSGPIQVTQRWKTNILHGRNIKNMTDNYMEIKYEDLVSKGPDNLINIFEWLGIKMDLDDCKKAIAACAIDNLKSGSDQVVSPWSIDKEPEGFFRKGEPGGWIKEMSATSIGLVEHVAGEVMRDLGYKPVKRKNIFIWSRLLLYKIYDTLFRIFKYVSDGLVWRIKRGLSRL